MNIKPFRMALLGAAGIFVTTQPSLATVVLDTNALANPSFETQGTSGGGAGTPDQASLWYQNSTQTRSDLQAHTGSYSLQGVSPQNGTLYPNSFGYVNLRVGNTGGAEYDNYVWTASLWGFIPSTGGLTSNSLALKVVFLNSSFVEISGATGFVQFLDGATGAKDTWVEGTLNGIIPVGAYYAQVQVMQFNGSATSGQTLYFDDASFVVSVPEPSSLLLLGLGGICLSGVFTRRARCRRAELVLG